MESLAINRVSQRGRLLIRSDLTDWPPLRGYFMLKYKRWRTVIGRAAFCQNHLTEAPCANTYTHGGWSRHVAVIDGAARTGQPPAVLVNAYPLSCFRVSRLYLRYTSGKSAPTTDNFYRGVGKK